MNLRPYQSDLIATVRSLFKRGKTRVILCAPTGSGKTVMFSYVTLSTLQKSLFSRALVLTDRIELLRQTFRALDKTGIEASVYDTSVKPNDPPVIARAVVAMIETVKRRYKSNPERLKAQLGNFDIVIIDEAHKANFKAIFDIYPDAFYIGATATPLATSKKDPLKNYYNDIAYTVDVPDLIESGHLAPCRPYAMRLINPDALKKDSARGDYTEASQYEEFSTPKVFAGVAKAYREKCLPERRKTIVFCVNIKHTIETAQQLSEAGYPSVQVTSLSTPEERAEAMRKFHSGEVNIMVNCGILTTGYDHPPISAVIMNRATMSLPLWLQCCGRGSRTSPETSKTDFVLIDMGTNIDRLGLWDEARDWKKWFNNPPKPGQSQPAPVKECPKCEAILPARATECEYCHHVFEVKSAPEKAVEGELVEVRKPAPSELIGKKLSELSVPELLLLYRSGRYKKGLIMRVLRSRGESDMYDFARIAGFKRGWAYYQAKNGETTYTNITIK
jgi:superfamily II DNA or RNA helicase